MGKPPPTDALALQPLRHDGLTEWDEAAARIKDPTRIGELAPASAALAPVKSVFETYFPGLEAIETDARARPDHYKDLQDVLADMRAKRPVNEQRATELIFRFLSRHRPAPKAAPSQPTVEDPDIARARDGEPRGEGTFEEQDFGSLITIV
jgi:hypothetical protein